MELTTINLVLLLIAQAIVSLAMTIGLVALALRGSRKLQDRLLFHSKALNRFAKYVLSDKYQTAMRDKARDAVLQELNEELAEQANNLELREQALQLAQKELEQRQLLLLKEPAESIAAADPAASLSGIEETELFQLEQSLASHQASAEGSALLAEINELRANLERQNAELARLRAQASASNVDENVSQLLEAQRTQLEQYQRMQRDMDMCVQVMEQELAQARENLQRVVVKLRQQTERNRELAERLIQSSGNR